MKKNKDFWRRLHSDMERKSYRFKIWKYGIAIRWDAFEYSVIDDYGNGDSASEGRVIPFWWRK